MVKVVFPGLTAAVTFAAEYVTSDATRITILRDALQELFDPANDGKTVVFTVRGNFASAKISATLKAAAPEPIAQSSDGTLKVMTFTEDGRSDALTWGRTWTMTGSGFQQAPVESGWYVEDAMLHAVNEDTGYNIGPRTLTATSMTFCTLPDQENKPAPGRYPDAVVYMTISNNEGQHESLTLPLVLVVE